MKHKRGFFLFEKTLEIVSTAADKGSALSVDG